MLKGTSKQHKQPFSFQIPSPSPSPNLRKDATESSEFECIIRSCCKNPCRNMKSIIFITNLLSKVNTLALTLSHTPLITLLCFVLLRFYSRRENTWSIIHYKQVLFFLSPCPQPPPCPSREDTASAREFSNVSL